MQRRLETAAIGIALPEQFLGPSGFRGFGIAAAGKLRQASRDKPEPKAVSQKMIVPDSVARMTDQIGDV